VKNVVILGLRIEEERNAQCVGKRPQGTGGLVYPGLFSKKEK